MKAKDMAVRYIENLPDEMAATKFLVAELARHINSTIHNRKARSDEAFFAIIKETEKKYLAFAKEVNFRLSRPYFIETSSAFDAIIKIILGDVITEYYQRWRADR